MRVQFLLPGAWVPLPITYERKGTHAIGYERKGSPSFR